MKIMLIGEGGREHALAAKMAENKEVETIYCATGNGGTAFEDKCINVNLTTKEEMLKFAIDEKIDLTVVGPETMLVQGIVDDFKAQELKIFGPSKSGANLEGSKVMSKQFMEKYGVKTAPFKIFEDYNEALDYLKFSQYPIVVKTDGLAMGKGVVVAKDYEEAKNAVYDFMVNNLFGDSGKKVVIEECLVGKEASLLCICDGETIIPFISAKDHKNIFDGDKGPNTGGMGSIAPNPYFTETASKDFKENIMNPTLIGIKEEKMDFCGIIFFGLMICVDGVYLLEYNVRMGDPETQSVLPLMKSDLVNIILQAIDGKLCNCNIQWEKGYCCTVVAASAGYPKVYKKGYEIKGIENVAGKVFIAGAKKVDGKIVTSGGRVLGVSAIGDTLEEAINKSYGEMKKISFDNIYYRSDIGKIKI